MSNTSQKSDQAFICLMVYVLCDKISIESYLHAVSEKVVRPDTFASAIQKFFNTKNSTYTIRIGAIFKSLIEVYEGSYLYKSMTQIMSHKNGLLTKNLFFLHLIYDIIMTKLSCFVLYNSYRTIKIKSIKGEIYSFFSYIETTSQSNKSLLYPSLKTEAYENLY